VYLLLSFVLVRVLLHSQSEPVRAHIDSRTPAARARVVPDTTDITNPLTSRSHLVFSSTLGSLIRRRLSAYHIGSRLLPLYNALVVRFSTPTLLFCFACFAASCHSARCSVNRRLLSHFLSYNCARILYSSPLVTNLVLLPIVPGHTRGLPRLLFFLPYHPSTCVLLSLLPYLTFYISLWRPFFLGSRFPQA